MCSVHSWTVIDCYTIVWFRSGESSYVGPSFVEVVTRPSVFWVNSRLAYVPRLFNINMKSIFSPDLQRIYIVTRSQILYSALQQRTYLRLPVPSISSCYLSDISPNTAWVSGIELQRKQRYREFDLNATRNSHIKSELRKNNIPQKFWNLLRKYLFIQVTLHWTMNASCTVKHQRLFDAHE